MKKNITKIFTIIIIPVGVFLVLIGIVQGMPDKHSTGATHSVCPTGLPACDFNSIQSAVYASLPGDTVLVSSGTYSENITINVSLTIKSEDDAPVIIDGNALSRVITINRAIAVNSEISVTLSGLTIKNGEADIGGGIYNAGNLILNESIIKENSATRFGGGIFNAGALTIIKSTIHNNDANTGGGLFNDLGGQIYPVTLENVTVSGNIAASEGGGLFFAANVLARDIATINTPTVKNSTITDNYASNRAGGIFTSHEPVILLNSIIADNLKGDDCYGSGLISIGYNLDSDNTCNLRATGDITNTSAFLGSLHNNGGRTRTHALLRESPAIDAGFCPNSKTDQRGEVRPVNNPYIVNVADGCDIGAYEGLIQLFWPIVLINSTHN